MVISAEPEKKGSEAGRDGILEVMNLLHPVDGKNAGCITSRPRRHMGVWEKRRIAGIKL